MPNTTGTAVGAADLLKKLNTFLTANGWTKLRGETDHNVSSPKAARYWRINVRETITTSSSAYQVRQLQWRTTTGGANQATNGANYSFSSLSTGSGAELVSGGATGARTTAIGNSGRWTITYDFGSATTIRELVMQCGSFGEGPRAFDVQWSNDNKTWTTMVSYDAAHFSTNNQNVTFTWDSGAGYTDARHPSATVARRGGLVTAVDINTPIDTEACDDIWAWQGPGFDAARRVYVYGAPFYETSTGTELIRFQCSTAVDTSAVSWFNAQVGSGTESSFLMFGSGTVTYWFYANSRRFIVVVKSGVDDYTSAYMGFMMQFALPADYPFPLFQGATVDSLAARMSTTNAGFRAFCDPGNGSGTATMRLWDNTWQRVTNHDNSGGVSDDPVQAPAAWVWPWHVGATDLGSSFPNSVVGGHNTFTQHFLDRIDPTSQGDLPLIPAILMNNTHGNIGVLDGVFAVPRGGVLSPEQVVTVSGTSYQVFSNRNRSGGQHYYAVRAD